jgi:hypothetical protein
LLFGGTRESSLGRERSIEAFHQYTEQRSAVYGLV